MLTRQGWMVVWGGLGLLAAGRLVGIGELYVFGAAALLLVVVAAIYVYLTRLDLEVDRRAYPARVYAGHTSRVEIRLRNLRQAASPTLRLRDPVSGTEGAELLVPPLERRATAAVTYRLPTERRGLHRIGPLQISMGDPFGLVNSTTIGADQIEVTVFPRIDDILPVPFTLGHDPLAGKLQPHALGRGGDDFYALRPYVVGDDLRHIHWPSTARHDELLVRQQEQPWQGRTTVMLDVRRATHDPDSLEVAVSAAASVVAANSDRNDLVRLVTTDGSDSGFALGRVHLESMLEHLAVVNASSSASLRAMLELLQRDAGGALVIIVANVAGDELNAITRMGRRYGSLTVVHITGIPHRDPRSANGYGPDGRRSNGGRPQQLAIDTPVVVVNEASPFDVSWNQFMRSRQKRRAARSGG
ncbi:MAG TPA: DUF58 domain-containing protein [Acidimicrobiales bacterium]|jgi:uncharacterized protein (DUF58 family)